MEQSSLLIGVSLATKFHNDLPVLALIREGMEFFTVFGYWNSGLGVNKIYILHSSGSVVSKEASDCAELM
jgi:hypothetical protein